MSRHQPALLGGVCIGVLSALPIVAMGNLCCCLWVVTGGALTVYLQQQNRPAPVETGEAVVGGLLAGVIGAILMVILQAVFTFATGPLVEDQVRLVLDGNPDLPPQAREMMLNLVTGQGLFVLILAIVLPVYAVFSMLGALLGLAIFRKAPPVAPVASQP
jgi:hypothetical protein